MASTRRKYDIQRLAKHLEFFLSGTGVSCMAIPEQDAVWVLNWVGDGTKVYKTDIATVKSDLTIEYSDFVADVPLGKEVADTITVITSTTPDQQQRFAAKQHTSYLIQRALACL